MATVTLFNGTTGNIQDVSTYDAGLIMGWVFIDATINYRFYVNCAFVKSGDDTNYNISYQTTGDIPPVGFSFTITAAGIIQYTMPSITGFLSGNFNYTLSSANQPINPLASTSMTLLNLRTEVRQRADMVNSQFVSDSELNSYINQSYFELYDLLISQYGNNYYVAAPFSFVTDGVNYQYSLPQNFYKLLGVDLALSNTFDSYVTIRPFEFIDRNRYAVPNFQSFYGITNLRYRINADKLWFTPIPRSGQTIRMWYIPRLSPLVVDTDLVDGISGWTEYIIVDAAIKCMQKEESDVSVLFAQKQSLINRIEAMAQARDAGSPAKVSDNLYADFWFPTGSGSGNNWGTY